MLRIINAFYVIPQLQLLVAKFVLNVHQPTNQIVKELASQKLQTVSNQDSLATTKPQVVQNVKMDFSELKLQKEYFNVMLA